VCLWLKRERERERERPNSKLQEFVTNFIIIFFVVYTIFIDSAFALSYQGMSLSEQQNDIKTLSTACNNFTILLYRVCNHIFIFYINYIYDVLTCNLYFIIEFIK